MRKRTLSTTGLRCLVSDRYLVGISFLISAATKGAIGSIGSSRWGR